MDLEKCRTMVAAAQFGEPDELLAYVNHLAEVAAHRPRADLQLARVVEDLAQILHLTLEFGLLFEPGTLGIDAKSQLKRPEGTVIRRVKPYLRDPE